MTWRDERARERLRRRHFPDVVLTTHEGRRALFYDDLVRERIVAINFMYLVCAQACPLTSLHLAQAQKLLASRMGRDVYFYSVTLLPEVDTPQALAAYARSLGAGPGWLFLRAEPADTELLRRKLGFFDRDPEVDADRSTHAGLIRYGNERRQWWGMLTAAAHAEGIARAIQRLSG